MRVCEVGSKDRSVHRRQQQAEPDQKLKQLRTILPVPTKETRKGRRCRRHICVDEQRHRQGGDDDDRPYLHCGFDPRKRRDRDALIRDGPDEPFDVGQT